ncbi:ParB/RepB/Spo0J family partition protein [Paraburkholderia sp. SIMBA_009]
MDLTSLSNLANFNEQPAEVAKGVPLEIPLEKIIPGKNPRTTFPVEPMQRLAAQIKKRRVKTPISVHPVSAEEVAAHFETRGLPFYYESRGLSAPADFEGFYQINHGERRYRGSVMAGNKDAIPAVIDNEHDGIDALVENIQRADLDPLDIARGIDEKVKEGMSKKSIAEEIGMSPSYVSNHLRLLKLPEPVAAMIREGKSQDVTALLALGSAYEEFPEEIAAFCEEAEEITQAQVRKYIAELKEPAHSPTPPTVLPTASGDAGSIGGNGGLDAYPTESGDGSGSNDDEQEPGHGSASGSNDDAELNDGGSAGPSENDGSAPAAHKPAKPKIAGIDVTHDGRPARLLLRVPTTHGLAWIKYEDDGQETEIEVGTIEQIVSVAVE